MKLYSITLDHFRQFYGQQTLTLSSSDDRNVTIVFGANGAGKTTLLAAFTWGLYGQFPPAFESPDRLVNERAWLETAPGSDVTARVIIQFEHEDADYLVERVTTVRKGVDGSRRVTRDGEITVRRTDPDGRTQAELHNPKDAINQILPMALHRFFFFDGERIEHLVKPTAKREIADAVKNLLGLEIIERAVRHLGSTVRLLENDLVAVSDDEVIQIQNQIGRDREQLELKEAERERQLHERAATEEELEAIRTRLRETQETRDLQLQQDALAQQLEATKQAHTDARKRIAGVINDQGYLAFTGVLSQQIIDKYAEGRERNYIPSLYKRQFIQDLLESGVCICGHPLVLGDEHYCKVEEWRDRAAPAGVEERANELAIRAGDFDDQRAQFFQELSDYRAEVMRLTTQRKEIEEALSEIKHQLRGRDSEDVNDLIDRSEELGEQQEERARLIERLNMQIDELNRAITDREKQRDMVAARNEKATVVRHRVQVAREARRVFSEILDVRTAAVRLHLDREIKNVYSRISYKDYQPVLDEDFRLHLTKHVSGVDDTVAKSTGENQILSLSFVGALAAYARDRYNEAAHNDRDAAQLLSFYGGIYPVVMDSPFGALDYTYRRDVARAIPILAPQVVVFVSKTQGLGPVFDELLPRLGKQYVITYFTPKGEASEEVIRLKSREIPYIIRSADQYEWAQLEEV